MLHKLLQAKIKMQILKSTFFFILLSLSFGCSAVITPEPPPLTIYGWLEQVRLHPSEILLHAKLDTGADNCSMHAENLVRFKKGRTPWIRFSVSNRYGDKKTIERRVIRTAKVKTKDGGFQSRPVVRLGMCISSLYETIECNLVDRSHFEYPVLIGRNFLAGSAIVNSSVTYTSQPNCSTPQKNTK